MGEKILIGVGLVGIIDILILISRLISYLNGWTQSFSTTSTSSISINAINVLNILLNSQLGLYCEIGIVVVCAAIIIFNN